MQGGVIPSLTRRGTRWQVIPPFQPGGQPFAALAQVLAQLPPVTDADTLEPELRTGGYQALGRRLRAVAGQHRRLIVIDQFEELFTLAGRAETEELLDLLHETLRHDLNLWVVATMRSEFLTELLSSRFAHLAHNPVTVGVLDGHALSEAIEGPAALAGIMFSPGLVSRMVTDTGGGDALPLLAYLLQQLYERSRGRQTLSLEDYERFGGVRGAISRRAERLIGELSSTFGEAEALRMLLKFVTWEGPEPTRRRVRRTDLADDEQQIADAFVNARLLTSKTDGEDTVLDVAHEALFRHWVPLRQEVESHADELRRRTQLERWAAEWVRSNRQKAFLLRGERLDTAMRWAEQNADHEVSEVAEFLAASRNDDLVWRERLSDSLAGQAMLTAGHDPELGILLAIAAIEECAPRVPAFRALGRAGSGSSCVGTTTGCGAWPGRRTARRSPRRHTTTPFGCGT
ncbi:nSTAND1 domain-containing NTPase [Nonomuraea cavernae]|uniref:nSTAND1 domain-containing NTPase n=1 Tax=Nonomuraea cavernae TaxID=2045107 RepID=UPI0033C9EE96